MELLKTEGWCEFDTETCIFCKRADWQPQVRREKIRPFV
jgi:hypothetical protein